MTSPAATDAPLTIDDLARQVGLPVRTIREYHTMRLLPPPQRRGRTGFYGSQHVERLQLIARLQRRGYSLAGIRDLLDAWENGTELATLLGVDEGHAALDETPRRLTRAELLRQLPILDEAALRRASEIGLVRPLGDDRFLVRSPALLGLLADWAAAGVPPGAALDVIAALTDGLDELAGRVAGLFTSQVWASAVATGRPGELPDLLRRGRALILQGTISTLADRLGAALAERAEATGSTELRAALDAIQVGAVADSAGRIYRRGDPE